MSKQEWNLDMAQSLLVEKACNALAAKLEVARKFKKNALVYECPVGEINIEPEAAFGTVQKFVDELGNTRTVAQAVADEANPFVTGTARMVALNCVQKGHGDNLIIEFVNWQPHIAIRL
ncbi:MAG: hypothetical protein EKK48_26420 [Candidatus Melainabacteria bacterium]|nr:MAG: hypothetical protein EKK48_26420 [Candidatus Melainabacteria bacterium]